MVLIQPIATFTAPSNISSDTDLTFNLTVTDDKNASNTATVKVTDKYIPPPNKPPIANTGVNQTVNAGDIVTLDGSKSRDPDGNITTYSWIQTAGPAVPISGANTATPSFTAPSVSSDTTLKFSLTVKDDKGAASNNPATVSVTVKAAVPSSSPSITPSISNQTGNATSMTTRENNQTNNATTNGYSFKTKWGSSGTADGQFDGPRGVAVDSSGNVYVADPYNHRIQKFDSSGAFVTKWGSKGSADGQFSNPNGVAVDSSGMYMWLIQATTVYKNSTATVHSLQSGVPKVQLMGNSVIQMALLLTLLGMYMWLIQATTVYKNSTAAVHLKQNGDLW